MTGHFSKNLILILAFVFSTVSCTKKKSDDISISISPGSPIVIPADYTYSNDPTDPDSVTTIEGPWFRFQVRISNPTDDEITVVALKTVLTSTKSGAKVTTETEHTSDIEDLYHLSVIPSKAEDFLLGNEMDTNNNGKEEGWTFFDGGLAEADSTVYTAEMEVIGWFGPSDKAKEPFKKKIRFRTQ